MSVLNQIRYISGMVAIFCWLIILFLGDRNLFFVTLTILIYLDLKFDRKENT